MTERSGADTRRQVLAAAVETILDRGYYQASSNEIARRAGVSWGVIQYYFKTREKLLLASLEEATAAYRDHLRAARIHGDGLASRLESFGTILWDYYGSDEWLAHLQIIVNLLHDPSTAQGTIDALDRALEETTADMNRLLDEAAAPISLSADDRRLIFAGLRGAAINELLLRTLYPGTHAEPGAHKRLLASMAEALAAHLAGRS